MTAGTGSMCDLTGKGRVGDRRSVMRLRRQACLGRYGTVKDAHGRVCRLKATWRPTFATRVVYVDARTFTCPFERSRACSSRVALSSFQAPTACPPPSSTVVRPRLTSPPSPSTFSVASKPVHARESFPCVFAFDATLSNVVAAAAVVSFRVRSSRGPSVFFSYVPTFVLFGTNLLF